MWCFRDMCYLVYCLFKWDGFVIMLRCITVIYGATFLMSLITQILHVSTAYLLLELPNTCAITRRNISKTAASDKIF